MPKHLLSEFLQLPQTCDLHGSCLRHAHTLLCLCVLVQGRYSAAAKQLLRYTIDVSRHILHSLALAVTDTSMCAAVDMSNSSPPAEAGTMLAMHQDGCVHPPTAPSPPLQVPPITASSFNHPGPPLPSPLRCCAPGPLPSLEQVSWLVMPSVPVHVLQCSERCSARMVTLDYLVGCTCLLN